MSSVAAQTRCDSFVRQLVSDVVLDAVNRRGTPFRLDLNASPLLHPDGTVSGVMLVIEPAPPIENPAENPMENGTR